MLEAVARLEPRWETELADVEFAVQEVPDFDTVGEEGVPLVACAVGNAIATLTGARLRELPFSPERVRGALGV